MSARTAQENRHNRNATPRASLFVLEHCPTDIGYVTKLSVLRAWLFCVGGSCLVKMSEVLSLYITNTSTAVIS